MRWKNWTGQLVAMLSSGLCRINVHLLSLESVFSITHSRCNMFRCKLSVNFCWIINFTCFSFLPVLISWVLFVVLSVPTSRWSAVLLCLLSSTGISCPFFVYWFSGQIAVNFEDIPVTCNDIFDETLRKTRFCRKTFVPSHALVLIWLPTSSKLTVIIQN